MKFLAIEQENKGVRKEEFLPHLIEEAETVWKLYQSDIIRELYFDKSRSAAVLVLEAPTRDDACKVLEKLPIVKNKLVHFDIYELNPYPGFARLMIPV